MFQSSIFKTSLLIFILLNISLYLFISIFHSALPFQKYNYVNISHHYIEDPRINGESFEFLTALGTWDAQWYLRIADSGYPTKQVYDQHKEPQFMGALTYAFYPFYPMILSIMDQLFLDIELTAFIITNILLVANFFSLYYFVTKLYAKEIAVRTVFLLFFFPFSIFYRSYYTEGLFLLLLLWFSYFLIKKQWFYSTLLVSLLFITRPNGLFMSLVFLGSLIIAVIRKELSIKKALLFSILSFVLFLGWLYFCYVMTGDMFAWYRAQWVWFKTPSLFYTITENIKTFLSFFDLPFHTHHKSKIDVLVILTTLFLLFKSRKSLKPQLWWISFIILIVPLLTKDTMSSSRFQIVSFPLFIYLGMKLKGLSFQVVSGIFIVLLFITGLYFVNWYWVG